MRQLFEDKNFYSAINFAENCRTDFNNILLFFVGKKNYSEYSLFSSHAKIIK